jgi:penicillin amidase
MANRFSDANSEIDNLALLTALKDQHGDERAMQIFNQLRWMTDSRAPTTVPEEEGVYRPDGAKPSARLSYALPRYDGTPPMLERVARDPQTRGVLDETPAAASARLLAQFAESGQPGIAGFPTTSNMWIVGRDHAKDARSILLNGPQFGWWNPAYTYGIGLHGAGFDVVGNTPFAYPSILFGHKAHGTWGSTAGFGDDVDIYAEKLDPNDRTRYFHDGVWKTMEKRTELIEVKDGQPVVMDVYRTVHGIVTKFDDKQHVAYAKARAWEGYELQSLMAWTHKAQSRNWDQWKQQAARHALTINWYYADDKGNIGYAHTGFYPKRRPGHDPRLPVPGTGEMDWDGMLPFSTNPQVYNPRQGFIANWNNQPMRGYPSTDLFAIVWGQADRYAEIETRLKAMTANGGKVSAQQMWDLIRTTSYADVNLRHFLPYLQQAVQGLPADDGRLAARHAQAHAGRRDARGLLQVVQRHRLSDAGGARHGFGQPDGGGEGAVQRVGRPRFGRAAEVRLLQWPAAAGREPGRAGRCAGGLAEGLRPGSGKLAHTRAAHGVRAQEFPGRAAGG